MRVGRGFAFVDLSGFTSFTDAHGDEEAGHVLTQFRAAVREVSSRRGVRVAKWQGDGAMFVSVERGPLVEAVLEIEEKIDNATSPLRLRGGMTFGHVILFEGDDYIGSAVNLAARLCDVAAPHEILVSCELEDFIPPWAIAEPAVPVDVRGFAHPVPVLRVHRREDVADNVKDPVCRMEIPRDAVTIWRGEQGFCSASCSDIWDASAH
ncbi:MAG TPA: adenylate/guanylate cyclase domain-containing protein [Acidimicrobiales bacterium]|nr:adenylate/guanylate cyclase domain-containing protein [Acidimicrobiales bacterium]